MKIGNRLIRVLAPLLLLFASSEAGAQETSYAQWVSVPMTVDIGEDESRPQLWLDMHARRFEGSTTTIFRPAVGWRFNKTIVAHAGYGFISTYADANGSAHEHRIWEQHRRLGGAAVLERGVLVRDYGEVAANPKHPTAS